MQKIIATLFSISIAIGHTLNSTDISKDIEEDLTALSNNDFAVLPKLHDNFKNQIKTQPDPFIREKLLFRSLELLRPLKLLEPTDIIGVKYATYYNIFENLYHDILIKIFKQKEHVEIIIELMLDDNDHFSALYKLNLFAKYNLKKENYRELSPTIRDLFNRAFAQAEEESLSSLREGVVTEITSKKYRFFYRYIKEYVAPARLSKFMLGVIKDPKFKKYYKDFLYNKILREVIIDESLIDEFFALVREEADEDTLSILAPKLAELRPHHDMDILYLPSLLNSKDLRHINTAIDIMGYNLQAGDRPILYDIIQNKEYDISIRKNAFLMLCINYHPDDEWIFSTILTECGENDLFFIALKKIKYHKINGKKIFQELGGLLLDLYFNHQEKEYYDVLLKQITNALKVQNKEDIVNLMKDVVHYYIHESKIIIYCVEILKENKINHSHSDHDQQIELVLELLLHHEDISIKEAAQKASWEIACRLVHIEELKQIYEEEKGTIRYYNTDNYYNFLMSTLSSDKLIYPWRFWQVFCALEDIYKRLDSKIKIQTLKILADYVEQQSWETYADEWQIIYESFANWLDFAPETIATPPALVEKLRERPKQPYLQGPRDW